MLASEKEEMLQLDTSKVLRVGRFNVKFVRDGRLSKLRDVSCSETRLRNMY
jgi:hypothetical protein